MPPPVPFEPAAVCATQIFPSRAGEQNGILETADVRTDVFDCGAIMPTALKFDSCEAQSQSNPSPLSNSLLTEKRTRNFVDQELHPRFLCLVCKQIQPLAGKFPTRRNRELLDRSREFCREIREIVIASKNPEYSEMRFSGIVVV
jgi:hypothetical protein